VDHNQNYDGYATGNGVIVAVIDSGADFDHPKLQGSFWSNLDEIPGDGIDNDGNGYIDDRHGFDFVALDGQPWDENGHGTFTAGIIAAQGDEGVRGLSPNADLMVLRTLDLDGRGSSLHVAEAIRYAVDNGAGIISLPLISGYSSAIGEALAYARSHHVFVVAAAGNDAADVPGEIAARSLNYNNLLSVGAVSAERSLLPESNRVGYSGAVQIDARGIDFGLVPGGGFGTYRGTSVAAAHVTGAAALALSVNPGLNARQLRELLVASVDVVASGSDSLGLLNVNRAVYLAWLSEQVALFVDSEENVVVHGTPMGDSIEFSALAETIRINDIMYYLPNTTADRIIVHGLAGNDRLRVVGTPGNDLGLIEAEFARLNTPGQVVVGHSFKYVNLRGSQGYDSLTIDGTAGNDRLVADVDGVKLYGNGIFRGGYGFENSRVDAIDGSDVVDFRGTGATERLVGTPEFGRVLRDGYFLQANAFDQFSADLKSGFDRVILEASDSGDSLTLTAQSAHVVGPSYRFDVDNVQRTTSTDRGGTDSLSIFGNADRDILNWRPGNAFFVGVGYDHRAYDFEVTVVHAGGGDDRATLVGSSGDDHFESEPNLALIAGQGFSTTVVGFPLVLALGQTGNDSATIDGSTGDDQLFVSTDLANFVRGVTTATSIGFEEMRFDGAGGNDLATLVDSSGDDLLELYQNQVRLTNDSFFAQTDNFDEVSAISQIDDGNDVIDEIDDSFDYVFEDFGDWQYV
jgi:subtilisin family serine protease